MEQLIEFSEIWNNCDTPLEEIVDARRRLTEFNSLHGPPSNDSAVL
jgi:hypothetical protein